MDIIQVLLLFGALQGLFLGIILLWKKEGRKHNIYLAIFLTLIGFQTYLFSMDKIYEIIGCPLVNLFSRLIFFTYGPLIYFYIRAVIDANFHWKKKNIVHFLPFLFVGVTSTLSYLNWGKEEYKWLHYIANSHFFIPAFYETLRWTYLLIYIGLSWNWLQKFNTRSRFQLSNPVQVRLSWLYQFLIVSIVLWSIVSFGIRINYSDGNPQSNEYKSLFFVLPLFIYWVSYNSITHPSIFQKISLSEPHELIPKQKNGNIKYNHSGLTPDKALKVKSQLQTLMLTEKPFLNPNLKLSDLAAICGEKPHHLSQVINEYIESTFYLYVNSFRIETAKTLLQDSNFNHLTIEAIAYESGFNSKSTFNTLFKKMVGSTPGEWKKLSFQAQIKPA